jgi:hypothetical protein
MCSIKGEVFSSNILSLNRRSKYKKTMSILLSRKNQNKNEEIILYCKGEYTDIEPLLYFNDKERVAFQEIFYEYEKKG